MCKLICLYFNVTSGYDFEYKNKLNSIPSTNAVEISRKLVTKCVFIILSCIYFVSAQICNELAVSSDTARNRQKMKKPKVENTPVCYLNERNNIEDNKTIIRNQKRIFISCSDDA